MGRCLATGRCLMAGLPPTPPRVEPRPPITSRLGAWWILAIGLAVGLVFAGTTHPLRATVAFAVSCFVAAGLRAALPPSRAGGLVVRGRTLDIVMLVGLGIIVLVVGRSMNLHPHV